MEKRGPMEPLRRKWFRLKIRRRCPIRQILEPRIPQMRIPVTNHGVTEKIKSKVRRVYRAWMEEPVATEYRAMTVALVKTAPTDTYLALKPN
jgi:hypothetical protein